MSWKLLGNWSLPSCNTGDSFPKRKQNILPKNISILMFTDVFCLVAFLISSRLCVCCIAVSENEPLLWNSIKSITSSTWIWCDLPGGQISFQSWEIGYGAYLLKNQKKCYHAYLLRWSMRFKFSFFSCFHFSHPSPNNCVKRCFIVVLQIVDVIVVVVLWFCIILLCEGRMEARGGKRRRRRGADWC